MFGHTHIARDVVIEGVRYVQQPLDYPKARRCGVDTLTKSTSHATQALGLCRAHASARI